MENIQSTNGSHSKVQMKNAIQLINNSLSFTKQKKKNKKIKNEREKKTQNLYIHKYLNIHMTYFIY